MSQSGPDASTTGSSSGSSGAPNPLDDASVEQDAAVIACDGGTIACGTSCVDVESNGAHCGSCGHTCGGGECQSGLCQPVTLLSGLAELHDLDVDSTHFYFSDGNLVERCAKDTPCEGAARTPLADFTGLNQDGTGSLAVHDGSIVFFGNTTAHTGIYGCPVTGCTTSGSLRSSLNGYDPFIAWSGDQALVFESAHGLKSNQCSQGVCAASVTRTTGAMSDAPLTATDTDYYFTRVASGANAALSRCPISEIPCTTVTDVSTVTNAQKLAATDQYLFVMWPGGQGGGTAVGYCGLAGCPDGALPTKLRASINTFVDMTAIHDRAFWIDDAGSIQTCSIASCVAPRTLASSLVDASQIVADDAFVYWIEGAGGAAGSIHRVAY